MRVLVLGATSLIGNNVLRAALAAGWEALAFDRPKRRHHRHPALEGLAVRIAAGQPTDPEALRQAMLGCDVVFHTEGYAPPNSLHHQRRLAEARQHIAPILHAAEAASIGRLVYTSSVSTIGRSDSPTRLPDEWNRYRLGQVHHPYWDAKLVQEEAVLALSRRGRIPVVVLNVSEVVGLYDFQFRSTGPLLEMVRRGIRQYMPGRVSVADARDVAQGHLAAADRGRPGDRYILAGHNLTHQEMLAVMARACKRPPPEAQADLESVSRWTRLSERVSCLGRPNRSFPLSYQLEALHQCRWYDSGLAQEELGYNNRPLLSTYRATLAWLKEVGKLK
jgi:dihydroflavonol-4-reductase